MSSLPTTHIPLSEGSLIDSKQDGDPTAVHLESHDIPPKALPNLNLPHSNATVRLQAIDTTTNSSSSSSSSPSLYLYSHYPTVSRMSRRLTLDIPEPNLESPSLLTFISLQNALFLFFFIFANSGSGVRLVGFCTTSDPQARDDEFENALLHDREQISKQACAI